MKHHAFYRRIGEPLWTLIDEYPDERSSKAGCSAHQKIIWQQTSAEAATRWYEYRTRSPSGALVALPPHRTRLRWVKESA